MMMRPFYGKMLAMVLSAFVFLMAGASAPHHVLMAAEPTGTAPKGEMKTTDGNGNLINCRALPEAKGGVLIGVIVPCVAKTIENVTISFSAAMIDWLKPTFYAFLVLVITLFGVKVLQGGGQLKPEAMLLTIKVAMVIGFLELVPTFFVPVLYDVMNDGQAMVANAIGPSGTSISCNVEDYRGPNTALVWAQVDCVLGKLYGITVGQGANGEKKPNMLLAASVFGLLGGFFFGGTFGLILFFACLGVLWTMFSIVLRTVVSFLNGYLFASLLLIISPLFAPLIFMKVTTSYFEPWWKGIIASILMPVLVTAYAMFALLLYDVMLFRDGSKMDMLFKNDFVAKAQEESRQACNLEATGSVKFREQTTGMSESDLAKIPFLKNFINPLISGANNQCAGVKLPALNMAEGSSDFNSNKDAFVKLFNDAMELFILSFLIGTGFTNVLGAIRRLTGSTMVSSVLDNYSQTEQMLKTGWDRSKQAMFDEFKKDGKDGKAMGAGGASGAEFVNRLPGAADAGFKGFIGGVSNFKGRD